MKEDLKWWQTRKLRQSENCKFSSQMSVQRLAGWWSVVVILLVYDNSKESGSASPNVIELYEWCDVRE